MNVIARFDIGIIVSQTSQLNAQILLILMRMFFCFLIKSLMDIVYVFGRAAALIVLGTETASFNDPEECLNNFF